MEAFETKEVKSIIEEAKKYPQKGRMYVYEMFKTKLQSLNLSYTEYEAACREIAKAVRV